MDWYLKVIKNYVGFEGRARRTEFWMFVLFNVIFSVAATILDTIIGTYVMFSIIYSLAVFLPGLAVSIRRLHDTGRSGWWLLISLIPIIGAIVLIYFAVLEGTHGDNEFGPDPKAA